MSTVARDVPLLRDPERFHVEKSCICQDLERLASMCEEKQEPSVTRHRTVLTTEMIGGRRVTVQHKRGPFFTSTR
jgi:hypothetical protein